MEESVADDLALLRDLTDPCRSVLGRAGDCDRMEESVADELALLRDLTDPCRSVIGRDEHTGSDKARFSATLVNSQSFLE